MCHTPLLIVIHFRYFRWENIINWHATHSTVLVRMTWWILTWKWTDLKMNFKMTSWILTWILYIYIYIRWCICQSLNSYHNNMILFWVFVCCLKILLCLPHSSSSVFSNNHIAMYLIIISLNSFFIAIGIPKSSQISILHQFKMGQNKPFTAVLPYEKRFL